MRDGNRAINPIFMTFCTKKARKLNALAQMRCTKGAGPLWVLEAALLDIVRPLRCAVFFGKAT